MLLKPNCFGSWICFHHSEGSDSYGIGVHPCIPSSCFIIENKLSGSWVLLSWGRNKKLGIPMFQVHYIDLICIPGPLQWKQQSTLHTIHVVWMSHTFFGTVTIKFALLLLWLLCLHGKLVTVIMIEFGLWLHTLGLNGDHFLWFLVSHWFLGCHGYGPKLLWWPLFLSVYTWVTLINQLPWVW